MNCPECGHHIVEHGLDACYGLLDNGEVCTCTKNAVDVGKHFSDQLAAWKAEAMAARELLSVSMEQIYSNDDGDIYCSVCYREWPTHTEKCTYRSVKDTYLAARVKDGAK